MDSLEAQFREWEKEPPPDLRGDSLWRMTAYRMAYFLADLARQDAINLLNRRAPWHKVDQLERSVESVESNISEGYSKFSGKERARYFETALSSAREARGHYRRTSQWLGSVAAEERQMMMTQIIKMLTVAIPRERNGASERRIRRVQSRPDST